ncbi:unnamed protein product, partial [Cyprideis torosa]
MVVGVPNVGKSTIINLLAGRAIAKSGNEAAVTKVQQRIDLKNGIVLFDTPGMLWPKIENDNSAYRLAITVLGNIARRSGFLDEHFWRQAEQGTYYVLFPCLLLANLVRADLDWRATALLA